ncbi:hypothetical protein IQ231_16995 [Cuspidothrix issatschenkoi LEGE 03284]|nr:hypothetical protein [Cuspidothrix issatschenkoi]MBE9233303.1 hypothetical protein [Cuspidothrix issatschenkoi LEGE 03284]MBE9233321.1 hypothetical protein [Cuspidothrix issatschenkoi LEGE 03284]
MGICYLAIAHLEKKSLGCNWRNRRALTWKKLRKCGEVGSSGEVAGA